MTSNLKPGCGTKAFLSESCKTFFESSIVEVCNSLRNSSLFIEGKRDLTESLLYSVISNLRIHYQKYYGKGSPRPRPLTIPHSSLFEDFNLNGALHTILSSILVGSTIRNIPFLHIFESEAAIILPILFDVEKNLVARGLWFSPCFFFNRVPVHYINRFSKIILEHGGTVAAKEETATHIIDCIDDAGQSSDDCEFSSRCLKVVGKECQIHWNLWPDSYEEIVESTDNNYNEKPISQRSLRCTHLVGGRFISDCEEFNEWGNEVDYEIFPEDNEDQLNEAPIMDTSSSRKSKQKKRGSQGSSQVMLRLAKESVVFQSNIFQEKLFSEITPLHLLQVETPTIDISTDCPQFKDSKIESNVCGTKRKADLCSVDDAVFDSCSWLSMEAISNVEYNYMNYVINSFASGGEASYLQLRNSIINLYVQSPSQYLSATECRRKISGDVGKIIRIHEFLDAFNVINYSVKYESRPRSVENYGLSIKRKLIVERLGNNFDKYSPTTNWSESMDHSLLETIKVHKMDWNLVASNFTELAVSPLDCMMRFLEISLESVSHIDETKELHETTDKVNVSRKSSLKNSHLILLRRILNLISDFNEGVSKTSNKRSVDGEAAGVLNDLFEKSIRNLRSSLNAENNGFLRDYLSNRIESIEHKVKVFRHIENLVKIDQKRVV